jgi:hypothetical protein
VVAFCVVLVVLISGYRISTRKNQLLAATPTAENTASSPDQMFDHHAQLRPEETDGKFSLWFERLLGRSNGEMMIPIISITGYCHLN